MLTIGWKQREPPLAVAGILVEGAVASSYGARLADRISALEDLRVVVGEGYLIALSEVDSLPWIETAIWLGMDDGLLCPTNLVPDLPSSLVAKAVSRGQRAGGVIVATPDVAIVASMPSRAPSAAMLLALQLPSVSGVR